MEKRGGRKLRSTTGGDRDQWRSLRVHCLASPKFDSVGFNSTPFSPFWTAKGLAFSQNSKIRAKGKLNRPLEEFKEEIIKNQHQFAKGFCLNSGNFTRLSLVLRR